MELLAALEIVGMPLANSPRECGKCGCKMFQHMICGLPMELKDRLGRIALEFVEQQFNPANFEETMLKILGGPTINRASS